jgi:parallel beta-helix repeat protein
MKNVMTILLVVLVLGLCGGVQADTLKVPDDYGTIQEAINAAEYGDTVEVAEGAYVENITLKNGVAVIGAGASNTTIDGGAAGSVVTSIDCGPDTVLEGFTITNGETDKGGGMYNNGGNPTITDCMFIDNTADWGEAGSGGGMCNVGGSSTITNCEFIGNTADYGGGMCNINCSPTVTDCKFVNNFVLFRGGGMNNRSSSSTVVNCTFIGNTADYHGGGMSIHFGSPTITDCEFIGNTAYGHGGGMHSWGSGSSIVTNCTFTGNSTNFGSGGGMYNSRSETVVNCTFSGNSSAYSGGGMLNVICSPTVTNCTFSENHAYSRGGGMKNLAYTTFTCDPIITNCIMWGNTSGEVDDQISNEGTSTPTISYCDIARCWSTGQTWNESLGINGGYNMDADPFFVDADGPDDIVGTEDDNLRLSPDSPCIDAGDNDAVPADVTTDLDGNPRIVNDVVDMGAYEYEYEEQSPADLLLQLIDYVSLLNIEHGLVNGLNAKLDAALEDLNENNDAAAVSMLEAFIRTVETQSEDPDSVISPEEATALITLAQEIIALL